jgi:hypothetical protein
MVKPCYQLTEPPKLNHVFVYFVHGITIVICARIKQRGDTMPLTDSKRRANNKYIAEHMTVLGCKVRKEDAEKFKKACAAKNTTPNEQFKKVVKAFIAEYEETPSN